MLLNTYKNHHTETLHIFTTFVFVPTPRSIYAAFNMNLFSFSSSFSLRLIALSHEYRHAYFFAYFLEYILLLLDNNVDEECQ